MNARFVLIAAAAVVAAAPASAKLRVGDAAPPMKIFKWVKGAPVDKLDKGKVYVVEFWATWCGPCRASIPHITELASTYKDKIAFAGINVSESDKGDKRVTNVTKFVKDMGEKMGYSVGLDDDGGTMSKSWMTAAGQNGIPTAFVIGKDRRIQWIGHPMELNKVLDPILKGEFDAKAAAAEREKAEAAQEAQQKMLAPVSKAVQAKDFKTAVAELDKIFAAHPDMEKEMAAAKFQFLMQYDGAAGFDYGKKLMDGLFKDDPQSLNSLAWLALDEKRGPKEKDYPVIIAMAERANKLSEGKDANIIDTLASAYAKSGDAQNAIATQEEAVAALPKDATDQVKKQFEDRLSEYKTKKD